MENNKNQQNVQQEKGWVLTGSVREVESGKGLRSYAVTAFDIDRRDEKDLLGRAVTRYDGRFLLRYRKKDFIDSVQEGLYEGGPDVVLEIRNRYGRVVKVTDPLIDAGRFEEINVEIEVRKEDQRPTGRKTPDPFNALRESYPAEIAVLNKAGIQDLEALQKANLSEITKKTGHSLEKLMAFRLHGEICFIEEFPKKAALALATHAGFSTRLQLSIAEPWELNAAIKKGKESGLIDKATDYSQSEIYGWVGAAKGLDTSILAAPRNAKRLITSARSILDRVQKANPHAYLVDMVFSLNPWVRLLQYAGIRSLMEEAGVHDLSTLGSIRIDGPRVFGPGFHLGFPVYHGIFLEFAYYLDDELKKRRYVKEIAVDRDCIRIQTNPVDEAVIIGSMIDFVEDGQLIIGEDVSHLTIITEEIRYSELNSIVFENGDFQPPPAPTRSPARRPRGEPHNDIYVYHPGDGNDGRHGGDGGHGFDGHQGNDGDRVSPAPNVTIYVRDTPEGLPDIILNGRRGGTGGAGQHGGHGGDGAKGRPGDSGACRCHRNPGHGGNGGNGGNGGRGGDGGRGGTAGSVEILTMEDNISDLATGRAFQVQITGGAGGNGGARGEGGNAGRGGAPGDGRRHCSSSADMAGSDGRAGSADESGDNGENGTSGTMAIHPIIESDWNAVFNTPYIVRLEPWEGLPGTNVQVIARNLTDDTRLLFGLEDCLVNNLDVENGTFDFYVPDRIEGGRHAVTVEVQGVDGTVHSNTQYFRVLPHLTSLSDDSGLPGTLFRLEGSGFAVGCMVRFGDSTYEVVRYDSETIDFTTPVYEELDTEGGPTEIQVINPDGGASEIMMFDLVVDIHIRIKAWRVLPEEDEVFSDITGPGSDRTDDEIRAIFEDSPTPAEIWADHHIILEFDPEIGIAHAPTDLIRSWPRSDDAAEQAAHEYLSDYYEDGALNVYFIRDFDNNAVGLTYHYPFVMPNQWHIVISDTPSFSDWEEAVMIAHEFGHAFELPHVCGDEPGTLFGRACEWRDQAYLMYPRGGPDYYDGTALEPSEITTARHTASTRFGE